MRSRAFTILALLLAPILLSALAYVARSTIWEASSEFYTQIPGYAFSVWLVQLPPLFVSELLLRRITRISVKRSEWFTGWGVYEIATGILLMNIFNLPELWFASASLVYAGFGSILVVVCMRI